MSQEARARAEILRTRDFVGWDVVDRAGDKIGSIADLLIDRAGTIRYVHMEHGLPRRHFLLPQHQLEWGEKSFVVDRWTRDRIRSLPPYQPDEPLSAPVLDEMARAYPWFYESDAPPRGMDAPEESRVVPLSEARSFRLEAGAPDPKGWNVFGSDGERVGTVHQLMVDPAAMKIRFLDVDLLDDLFLLNDDRHVLVPLEQVDLKERGNDAWVRGLTAAQVSQLPAYTGGPVEGWLEERVAAAFGPVV